MLYSTTAANIEMKIFLHDDYVTWNTVFKIKKEILKYLNYFYSCLSVGEKCDILY
jgi:hypothetical protein